MFQNCLIKAAKLTLSLKKIKTNCKNSDKKSNITSEHKKYRQFFKLLSAFNKVEKSKNYEKFNNLIEQIKTFNKDNPILKISENNCSTIKDIQWNEWKKKIKGTISILREECYRIENSTKLKAINEAIIQRY